MKGPGCPHATVANDVKASASGRTVASNNTKGGDLLVGGVVTGDARSKKKRKRSVSGGSKEDPNFESRLYGQANQVSCGGPCLSRRISPCSPTSTKATFLKEDHLLASIAIAAGAPKSIFKPLPLSNDTMVTTTKGGKRIRYPNANDPNDAIEADPTRGSAVIGERVRVTAPDEKGKLAVYDAVVLQRAKGLYKVSSRRGAPAMGS